jgi:hypothetical protein
LTKYVGTDVQFRTRKLNVFGFILPEAVAGIYLGLLGILGFAGFAKIAAKLPIYNGIFFVTCQVVHSTICSSNPGDYSAGFHLALAFAEGVALFLMSCEQWVFLFLWDGLFFSLIAFSVSGLGEGGAACARRFYGLGGPFVLLGGSIKALQLWTCRAAHQAIQSDFSMYQAMWDSIVSDPDSLIAIRDMEVRLAGLGDSFVRCSSSGLEKKSPLTWFRAFFASVASNGARAPQKSLKPVLVHQEILARNHHTGSLYNVLTQPEETDLQTQLTKLYEDAERADSILRPWVLELAGQSGGMLRATTEYQTACASQAGSDVALVDGEGGVWYMQVTKQTTLGDVDWAGLKNPARSAEKVMRDRQLIRVV